MQHTNNILLFLDEVQCGFGRSGKLFSYEWANIEPDILASAKGIGSGFPMGACLSTNDACIGMTKGIHGSTYGGNPLAIAVGKVVLEIILKDDFLQKSENCWKFVEFIKVLVKVLRETGRPIKRKASPY